MTDGERLIRISCAECGTTVGEIETFADLYDSVGECCCEHRHRIPEHVILEHPGGEAVSVREPPGWFEGYLAEYTRQTPQRRTINAEVVRQVKPLTRDYLDGAAHEEEFERYAIRWISKHILDMRTDYAPLPEPAMVDPSAPLAREDRDRLERVAASAQAINEFLTQGTWLSIHIGSATSGWFAASRGTASQVDMLDRQDEPDEPHGERWVNGLIVMLEALAACVEDFLRSARAPTRGRPPEPWQMLKTADIYREVIWLEQRLELEKTKTERLQFIRQLLGVAGTHIGSDANLTSVRDRIERGCDVENAFLRECGWMGDDENNG